LDNYNPTRSTKPRHPSPEIGGQSGANPHTGEDKPLAPAYSHEPIATTTFDNPSHAPSIVPSSETEPVAVFIEPSWKIRLSRFLTFASSLRHISLPELTAFLKRTKRLWLTTAGAVFGLIAVVILVQYVVERAREARERRRELAVATVNPDRLIARCGEAVQDVTKQVFPIVMRTIRYTARGDRTLDLVFSRTAEEKSDWVFLSMRHDNGSVSYDTPDAKIAALPCLDSTK